MRKKVCVSLVLVALFSVSAMAVEGVRLESFLRTESGIEALKDSGRLAKIKEILGVKDDRAFQTPEAARIGILKALRDPAKKAERAALRAQIADVVGFKTAAVADAHAPTTSLRSFDPAAAPANNKGVFAKPAEVVPTNKTANFAQNELAGIRDPADRQIIADRMKAGEISSVEAALYAGLTATHPELDFVNLPLCHTLDAGGRQVAMKVALEAGRLRDTNSSLTADEAEIQAYKNIVGDHEIRSDDGTVIADNAKDAVEKLRENCLSK